MKYDVANLRARLNSAWEFGIDTQHTETEHYYVRSDTGRVAPSVSTKLGFANKEWLAKWKIKKCLDYLREHRGPILQSDAGQFELFLEEAAHSADRIRDDAAGIGTSAHAAVEKLLTQWIHDDRRPARSGQGVDLGEGSNGGWVPTRDYLEDGARSEEIAACRSFDRFLEEREAIPLASEIRLWYEYGKDIYAGSCDAVLLLLTPRKGRVGDPTVVDLEGRPHRVHDYSAQDSGSLWCAVCGRECDASLVLADWKTSNAIRGKDEYALQGEAYARAIEKATRLKFAQVWVVRLDKGQASYEICKIDDRKQAWQEFIALSRAYDAKAARKERSLLAPLEEKTVYRI